jgi:hypothetical protein
MELAATLAALVVAVLAAAGAGWMGARPPDLKRGPRLAPWRAIMMTAAVCALMMLVHLVNLAGVSTGR